MTYKRKQGVQGRRVCVCVCVCIVVQDARSSKPEGRPSPQKDKAKPLKQMPILSNYATARPTVAAAPGAACAPRPLPALSAGRGSGGAHELTKVQEIWRWCRWWMRAASTAAYCQAHGAAHAQMHADICECRSGQRLVQGSGFRVFGLRFRVRHSGMPRARALGSSGSVT